MPGWMVGQRCLNARPTELWDIMKETREPTTELGEQVEEWKSRCPIKTLREKLLDCGRQVPKTSNVSMKRSSVG